MSDGISSTNLLPEDKNLDTTGKNIKSISIQAGENKEYTT